MSYATLADVFVRYTPIKTMVGSGVNDVASTDITSGFLPDATSMVDAYIGSRYVTPLGYIPPIITQITADLAIFNLSAERLPRVPDFMQARYDRAMKNLEMLRDGKMTLGVSVTVVTNGNQEAWSPTTGYHPVFSPVLRDVDQRVDNDYVQSQRDEREDDIILP